MPFIWSSVHVMCLLTMPAPQRKIRPPTDLIRLARMGEDLIVEQRRIPCCHLRGADHAPIKQFTFLRSRTLCRGSFFFLTLLRALYLSGIHGVEEAGDTIVAVHLCKVYGGRGARNSYFMQQDHNLQVSVPCGALHGCP